MSTRTCKKCGNRTRDQRCGICDRCAFPKVATLHRDHLAGGKADRMEPRDFDRRALRVGRKHEQEHTKSKGVATEIAMDHLAEDPDYYKKLRRIEKLAQMVKYTKRKKKEDLLKGEMPYLVNPEDPPRHDPTEQNQIDKAAMAGFADELQKIAYKANLGTRIVKTLGGWGKALATTPQRSLATAGDLVTQPIKTMKQGWHSTWTDPVKSGGVLGRGLFLAGTGLAGASALPKEDPMGRGESRLTRAARFAGGTALGIAGMKRGVLPSIALGIGGDVLGGYAGRAIDRARGRLPVKPPEAA